MEITGQILSRKEIEDSIGCNMADSYLCILNMKLQLLGNGALTHRCTDLRAGIVSQRYSLFFNRQEELTLGELKNTNPIIYEGIIDKAHEAFEKYGVLV